jgi:hypothetical protein
MELTALRGMRDTLARHRPDLYMEMHGATVEHKDANVRAIVDFVTASGYTDITHVESGTAIMPANATDARRGHLFCRGR